MLCHLDSERIEFYGNFEEDDKNVINMKFMSCDGSECKNHAEIDEWLSKQIMEARVITKKVDFEKHQTEPTKFVDKLLF